MRLQPFPSESPELSVSRHQAASALKLLVHDAFQFLESEITSLLVHPGQDVGELVLNQNFVRQYPGKIERADSHGSGVLLAGRLEVHRIATPECSGGEPTFLGEALHDFDGHGRGRWPSHLVAVF